MESILEPFFVKLSHFKPILWQLGVIIKHIQMNLTTTHFPSRKVLHFYLVIMTTSMGWGVILIFCSCNKLNCSKKEIFSCDYTMAGVQTEKLALQTQHHRHLHKTVPSLTCTFCILVYGFAPTNYSLT